MRPVCRIGLLTLGFLLAVGPYLATVRAAMVPLSLQQLASEADIIVRGTVLGQSSAWNPERTAIHTDVTVRVQEVIAGSPAADITFRVAGGIVGDIGMRTSTDPVFQDGEQVIVFLRTTESTPASIAGLRQGKYTVADGRIDKDGWTLGLDDFIDAIHAARK